MTTACCAVLTLATSAAVHAPPGIGVGKPTPVQNCTETAVPLLPITNPQ